MSGKDLQDIQGACARHSLARLGWVGATPFMPRYIFTAKLDTIDDRVVRALNPAPSPLLPNLRDSS